MRSATFPSRGQTSPLARRRGRAEASRSSARRRGGAELGAGQAGVTAQPPGPRWKESIATGEMVGAGTAIRVEESLVALEGLDARPLVPTRDPWGYARSGPGRPLATSWPGSEAVRARRPRRSCASCVKHAPRDLSTSLPCNVRMVISTRARSGMKRRFRGMPQHRQGTTRICRVRASYPRGGSPLLVRNPPLRQKWF